MKTLAEIYLPAEQLLVDHFSKMIQDIIKERKKIPYLDSEKNPNEEFLEYFIVTDALISFKRQNSKNKKCEVTGSQLRDAIKYALRTDEALTKQGFNKQFGINIGTSIYSFISLITDEIMNKKVFENEISHKAFGKGNITKIEFQNEFVLFKYAEDCKKLSMAHFTLEEEDELMLKNKLSIQQ